MTTLEHLARSARLRRMATRQGLRLASSRTRDPHAPGYGGWQIRDRRDDGLVFPPPNAFLFYASLDDCEAYLMRTTRT